MGEAIASSTFDRSDEIAFRERLGRELEMLAVVLERPGFGEGPASVGAEVELALVDRWMRPAHVNLEVLAALGDEAGPDGASPELDAFCVELDTPPGALAGTPFTDLRREIDEGVERVQAAARAHACHAVALGILPTVGVEDLASDRALTAEARYAALGRRLAEERADDEIDLEGEERLALRLPSIAIEGVMSALQVHLKVPPERFREVFNASHVVSAPAVALAANSPFPLGAAVWPESRIPLFRQVVDGARPRQGHPSRAPLAHGWLRGSPLELFAENVRMYPPLLPVRESEDDEAGLHALRLHSGTIWRWNRPVLETSGDGHVRVELRALPSGPTVEDMVANAAFLLGATLALSEHEWLPEAMPFAAAEANLLAAARGGLDATVLWPSEESPSPRPRPVREVCAELLPRAADALQGEGVPADELAGPLATVAARLERGATGAAWQRAVVARYEPELGRERAIVRMMRALTEIGPQGPSVAEWDV
jgi:hypothetical protein